MKKILLVFFTFAIIFTFVGCINNIANNGHASSEASGNSKNKPADEPNKGPIDNKKKATPVDNKKEAASVKKMTTMNITVGNKTFTATIENNETAKELVKKFPLTVDMSELHGNEKYNYLSSNLPGTASCPGKINEGDLMLYGNNCLVLFYKTFNTSYSYVKLGHIDNTVGLTEAVGSGSVKVTFSLDK